MIAIFACHDLFMSVTITLPEEIEARIYAEAARAGLGVEGVYWQNHWASVPTPALSEATFLENIGEGFPESFWLQYRSIHSTLDYGSIP